MLLVKSSEIILKRRATRIMLESRLLTALREALGPLAHGAKIRKEGGMFIVELEEEGEAANRLRNVFGVHSLQMAVSVPSKIPDISEGCVKIGKEFRRGSSFALRVKRIGSHQFTSNDVANIVGKEVKERCKLKVDLDNPDNVIYISVREKTYISKGRITGVGGFPVGSQGAFVFVVSPRDPFLAGWMAMKKGGALILLAAYSDGKGRKRLEKMAKFLEWWHVGKKMMVFFVKMKKLDRRALAAAGKRLAGKERANGVVFPQNDIRTALLFPNILFPLVGFEDGEVKKIEKDILKRVQ